MNDHLSRPWACWPASLPAVIHAAMDGEERGPFHSMEISGEGLAEIRISGALYGGYGDLCADLAHAAKHARAAVVQIDSPGGAASGCMEAAAVLGEMRIPVAVAVESVAASAAYALASGADRIFAMPSSIVGSIGVIIPMLDTSGLWEAFGVKPDYLVSGDLKAAGYPPSMTDDHRASLQSLVDDLALQFFAHVETYRRVDSEVFRAGVYAGPTARRMGLVDQIGSLADARKWVTKKSG